MVCTPPAIVVKIQPATGLAHAQHGLIVLANGTRIELNGDSVPSPQATFLEKLRPKDKVVACFVESQSMSGARLCIVENADTKDSFYTLGIPKGGKSPFR
jgi:hypothetical protein